MSKYTKKGQQTATPKMMPGYDIEIQKRINDFATKGFSLCAGCNKPFTELWFNGKCDGCFTDTEFDELLGRIDKQRMKH